MCVKHYMTALKKQVLPWFYIGKVTRPLAIIGRNSVSARCSLIVSYLHESLPLGVFTCDCAGNFNYCEDLN